jgi:hypothetical protein
VAVPGGVPGQHLGAPQLVRRLKKLQIPPHSSCNTALMELAAEMPAKVLSDGLGISIESA